MICVVVFIISTEKTEYEIQAKNIWRMYMNKFPEIKCIFIENEETLNTNSEYYPEQNLLKIRGRDSIIPGIFIKTIYSFKWFLSNKEFSDCDYIIRTNLSSFWIFNRLLDILNDIRPNNYVMAKKVFGRFPSGCGMVLSRDIVEKICKFKYTDTFINSHNDDVLIGNILNSLGIFNYNGNYHHNFGTLPDRHQYHVRCKLGHEFEGVTVENRVQKEIPYLKKLLDTYYYTFNFPSKYFNKDVLLVGDFEENDLQTIHQNCNIIHLNNFSLESVIHLQPVYIIAIVNDSFSELLDYALSKSAKLQVYIKDTSKIDNIEKIFSQFDIYHQNSKILDFNLYLKMNKSCILIFIPNKLL